MRIHRAPVLVLCALALAACQPSSPFAQQTQQAQSAFNAAVAAAQTQAAPSPSPIPTAIPSQEPAATSAPQSAASAPTLFPAVLVAQASTVKTFMEGVLQGIKLPDETPLDAHVTFVRYEYNGDGSAAHMEVGVQRSDQTTDWTASSAAIASLVATFSTQASPNGASRQRKYTPAQLRTFRIHVYDLSGKEHVRIAGNWEDALAYGAGSLTLDAFLARLDFQQESD